MDIQKYRPVIDDILRKLKVPRDQQEDMRQDCYVELLMKQPQLETATDQDKYVAVVCKNHILSVWRDQKVHTVTADSLDDPRVFRKAAKIQDYQPKISSETLREAAKILSPEESEVVNLLYVVGHARNEAADILSVHPNTVDRRAKSAVKKLKDYFGVD